MALGVVVRGWVCGVEGQCQAPHAIHHPWLRRHKLSSVLDAPAVRLSTHHHLTGPDYVPARTPVPTPYVAAWCTVMHARSSIHLLLLWKLCMYIMVFYAWLRTWLYMNYAVIFVSCNGRRSLISLVSGLLWPSLWCVCLFVLLCSCTAIRPNEWRHTSYTIEDNFREVYTTLGACWCV